MINWGKNKINRLTRKGITLLKTQEYERLSRLKVTELFVKWERKKRMSMRTVQSARISSLMSFLSLGD